MILKKETLKQIGHKGLEKVDEALFDLPERVIQFGTGVLLRGLPDYFIDKANAKGIFSGRIVVVKSTDQGRADTFNEQDNLYTVCVRGYQNGQVVKENRVCSAISRVLSAKEEWQAILDCAANPEISVVISNTTESGIKLTEDNVNLSPPVSFPGKLLSFLFRRYNVFHGSTESGVVIVPTELIPDNGKKLESILLDLALKNRLGEEFINWLKRSNYFCNSLVDRIVPGKPAPDTLSDLHDELGYQDDLLIMAEPYKLWAIEGPERVKDILSFHSADSGVVIESNIDKYRELKLRILNGSHTFCCGLAFMLGFKTVSEAMADEAFLSFITALIHEEIVPAVPYAVSEDEKRKFGNDVLDRFRNPNIAHKWHSITMNYSSKMKVRNVALILNYYKIFNRVPERFALGFAGYMSFMKPAEEKDGVYFGEMNGELYPIQDEMAGYFKTQWQKFSPGEIVREILKNESLWGHDLSVLKGFCDAITEKLILLQKGELTLNGR